MQSFIKTKFVISLLFLGFTTSCTHQNIDEKLSANLKKSWDEYFHENFITNKEMEIFVVTNRQEENTEFGCSDDNFGINLGVKLAIGSCKITVPKNHEVGEITLAEKVLQSPSEVFRVGNGSAKSLAEIIAAVKKTNRTPLVFVHGFNVRYQEALLRAAQIAYDLKYQGPVILFTWPAGSGDGLLEGLQLSKTYDDNFANAKNSIATFKEFLLSLQKNNLKINLMVHSMGHQIALPALSEIAASAVIEHKKNPPILVNKLILNAPDFASEEFKIAVQNIKNISNKITLYCSNNDKALMASRTFNNNARAGACVYAAEIDTVDVSKIDDSVLSLGHGYYSSRAVLGDIFLQLIEINSERRLFITKGNFKTGERYLMRK